MARLTLDSIEQALKKAQGNISAAAGALGVARSTLYRRIEKSTRLQEVLKDSRESLVDVAETALKHGILQGNTALIIFALKTLGKDRGYVERVDHRHELLTLPSNVLDTLTELVERLQEREMQPGDVFELMLQELVNDANSRGAR